MKIYLYKVVKKNKVNIQYNNNNNNNNNNVFF